MSAQNESGNSAAVPPPQPPQELPPPVTSANTTPKFSKDEITVMFVLGGPGSGKGTQSANLVRDYGFIHLSAGDLLRQEQDREGSQYGDLIRNNIKEGIIVPMEITVALLSNAMSDALKSHPGLTKSGRNPRFLIDGFPRKLDQAHFFEDTVCHSTLTLFLNCPEDVMQDRLLKRGETSGRADDNIESIRKRFRVFQETSMPVVDYYETLGKVVKVVATGGMDEVYQRIREGIEGKGILPLN